MSQYGSTCVLSVGKFNFPLSLLEFCSIVLWNNLMRLAFLSGEKHLDLLIFLCKPCFDVCKQVGSGWWRNDRDGARKYLPSQSHFSSLMFSFANKQKLCFPHSSLLSWKINKSSRLQWTFLFNEKRKKGKAQKHERWRQIKRNVEGLKWKLEMTWCNYEVINITYKHLAHCELFYTLIEQISCQFPINNNRHKKNFLILF